jgi:hypothetical protein
LVLIDPPDDLVAVERPEVLGQPVRDALPLNRHYVASIMDVLGTALHTITPVGQSARA